MSRQYLTAKFAATDKRAYTYHWDGERPLRAGDKVRVAVGNEGKTRVVTVVQVGVPAPTQFETKAVLGLEQPTTGKLL